MQRILISSTILAFSAGFASAEVTLSGDARMGIISNFDDIFTPADESVASFTSRARVSFTLSGESDSGLAFGASFRADNAGGAASGTAGSVFVSGAFGKLTMGDIDGAAQQAVGNVAGVGLTGLGDLNEAVYLHNYIETVAPLIVTDGTQDPTAAYEYSTGAFTGIISVTNPGSDLGVAVDDVLAVGVKYAAGNYTVALGYETFDTVDHVIVGATATFGAVSLAANYGQLSAGGSNFDQYHVSATYTADALSLTAFVSDEDDLALADVSSDPGLQPLGKSGYGIGASYDLGGGAKVVGGYAKHDLFDESAFDLGLSFSF